ncbi:MAG: hypothetical protein MJ252_08365 [archaeon]|nr:hypothetical protein [archaeon]
MVKIKAICRDTNDYNRKTNTEITKVYRNTNPRLHPFQHAREYIRALNAVKLDKLFSKPFLFSLSETSDCVKSMCKNLKDLTEFASGCFDGQIIIWNLPDKKPIFNIKSNHPMIKGISYSNDCQTLISCGDDGVINFFNKKSLFAQKEKFLSLFKNDDSHRQYSNSSFNNFPQLYSPINEYHISEGIIEGIDHSYMEPFFATSGSVVSLWNYERNFPFHEFKNCEDGYIKTKFNYTEKNILLATAYDRTVTLFDIRTKNPIKSVTLPNKSACACWNPQEPFNFTLGNEDSNCYTFDMRKLDKVRMIHKDHILSVLDIDYSPTGKEFVTGSFDKTIRIFNSNEGNSKECYHSKRMQKVYSVLFSLDSKYVLSGSDDTNIRIWKAIANEPIKLMDKREKDSREYGKKLVDKFKYMPEIKKIKNRKNLPKYIINKRRENTIKREMKKKKIHNIERNSKIGTVDYTPERIKKVLKSEIVNN